MFQRGTGERFKYKAAVIKHFPSAICKQYNLPTREYISDIPFYVVLIDAKRITEPRRRAEDAWEDSYWELEIHKREIKKDIQ